MKLIVTGGAGFIGSNLVRLLIRRGHEVLNIDKLTYAGNITSLRDLESSPNYHFLQADICDAAAMRTAFADFQPHGVMHLAAESHVDRSIDGPGAFIQTNILGTYILLQTSLEYWQSLKLMGQSTPPEQRNASSPPSSVSHNPPASTSFRFLHVSTDEVYGSLGDTGRFSETTPYAPKSPYSASKAASDHLARAWHNTYGLPVIVTNCSNNYGPYQFPEKLLPVVLLKALRGEPIPVYGMGNNIRDWLYVEDHAAALLTVIDNGACGETYNIGGNNELRNIDLVRLICNILDAARPAPGGNPYADLITFVADRPGHDHRYAVDTTKIKNDLGWTPQQDHESGFVRTVHWYLEHESWWREILDQSYQLQRLGTTQAVLK